MTEVRHADGVPWWQGYGTLRRVSVLIDPVSGSHAAPSIICSEYWRKIGCGLCRLSRCLLIEVVKSIWGPALAGVRDCAESAMPHTSFPLYKLAKTNRTFVPSPNSGVCLGVPSSQILYSSSYVFSSTYST